MRWGDTSFRFKLPFFFPGFLVYFDEPFAAIAAIFYFFFLFFIIIFFFFLIFLL
jgi:hypothetical protein